MDPLSIVQVSADIVGICTKLSAFLSRITKNVGKADPTIGLLRTEIDCLSQVLTSIGTSFKDPILVHSVLACQTGFEEEHWLNTHFSMEECKVLLEQLQYVVEPLSKGHRSSDLKMQVEGISHFMQEIVLYRKTMEMCSQLIMLFSLLGDQNVNTDLPSRIDQLTLEMQQLLWLFAGHMDTSILLNLEECVRSASMLLAAVRIIVERGGANKSENPSRRRKTAPQITSDGKGYVSPIPSSPQGRDCITPVTIIEDKSSLINAPTLRKPKINDSVTTNPMRSSQFEPLDQLRFQNEPQNKDPPSATVVDNQYDSPRPAQSLKKSKEEGIVPRELPQQKNRSSKESTKSQPSSPKDVVLVTSHSGSPLAFPMPPARVYPPPLGPPPPIPSPPPKAPARSQSARSDPTNGPLHGKRVPNSEKADQIKSLLQIGTNSFTTKDYRKAQTLLEQVLRQSESEFGNDFTWRAKTMDMLVVSYCNLGKWVELNNILNEQYEGRNETLVMLTSQFCQERRWEDAMKLLYHEFEGKEGVLEKIARAFFVLDRPLAEAKPLLTVLMKYKGQDTRRGLERMYILAELCWRERDLNDAKRWCMTALEGENTVLEKSDPLFYQFVKLLVQICDAQHDHSGAENFSKLLSSDVQECAEIQRLCALQPKEAARQFEKAFTNLQLGSNKQRNAIKENIKKGGGLIGSGRGWALIHAFAANDRELCVKALLDKGAHIEARDEGGNTPLHIAATKGCVSTTEVLLGKGANHNLRNKCGDTALMSATMNGHESVVRVLLRRGADIETRDKDQNTLLMIAVTDKLTTLVNLFLENKANIEAQNKLGRTALMIAVLTGDQQMTKLLLDKGANIEAKDKSGTTPLMHAAAKENVNIMDLLLLRGANIEATNKSGQSALSLAKAKNVYRAQVVNRLLIAHARAARSNSITSEASKGSGAIGSSDKLVIGFLPHYYA